MRLRSSHRRDAGTGWGVSALHASASDATVTDLPLPPRRRAARDPWEDEPDAGARSVQAAILARHGEQPGTTSLFVLGSLAGVAATEASVAVIAGSLADLGYRTLLAAAESVEGAQAAPSSMPGGHGDTDAPGTERLRVRSTGHAGLSLLQIDDMFPRLAEAVVRGTVARRLRAAASQFDIVLIDAGSADAESLAGFAAGSDGVVLFARRHRTRLSTVEHALTNVELRGGEILGAVLF